MTSRVLFSFWLVMMAGQAIGAPGDFHRVKPIEANVYESPSETAKVKLVALQNRRLVEFEREGEWIWVGVDGTGGQDGWIKESDTK